VPKKKLVERSFLIPIRRDKNLSDGKPHRRTAWNWCADQLMMFDGATMGLGLYEGWYPDPDTGKRVKDKSRRFWIAIPANKIRKLRVFLREACRVFYQKCIYLSVAGKVEFVKGDDDERD
jgi:hypothetical protein